jgi:glycine cleavage system H protein
MARIGGYEVPDGLHYHKEHAWVRLEDDGTVTVGMTQFFAKNSGDIEYVDLPFAGDEVSQDETCGKVQSSQWIGKLVAPVSGKIVAVNQELENNAALINQDPYAAGWYMKIQPSRLDDELGNLMSSAEDLTEWIQGEIKRVQDEKRSEN